jgi:hypothetical protein
VRKISVTATTSGNGKTTAGRELARRLDVPFVELDALVHGPDWVETPDDELRRLLEPTLAGDGWVIDGGYRGKIGNLVWEHADLIVWIDLPLRVWMPRLLRRTVRRLRGQEELWNGNKETIRGVFFEWNALFPYAFRAHFRRRREYMVELADFPHVRLRSQAEVDAFVAGAGVTAGEP